MARGMKRPAAADASGAAAKRKALSSVAEAVKAAPELASGVRNMLSVAVSDCLATYAEERHDYQKAVVDMLDETMSAIEASLTKAVEAAKATVDGSDAEKASKEAKVGEVEADEAAKAKVLADAEAALAADEAALAAASTAEKEAADAASSSISEAKAAVTQQALVNSCKEKYAALKDAAEPGPAGDLKELASLMRKLDADGPLVSSMQDALKKVSAERSTFDGLASRQCDEWLAGLSAAADAALGTTEAAKGEKAAAAEVAVNAKKAAEEKTKASSESVSEAKVALKAAKVEVKAAKKAVSSFEKDKAGSVKNLAAAEKKKEGFVSGALASFKDLKVKTRPPPPAPEPEEPAAPVEEAAAPSAPATTPA